MPSARMVASVASTIRACVASLPADEWLLCLLRPLAIRPPHASGLADVVAARKPLPSKLATGQASRRQPGYAEPDRLPASHLIG
jgi:hypothetical protein